MQITKNMLERAKRLLYCAHYFRHINYANITWGPMCSQQAKDQIYEIQKDCIWLTCNKPKTSHYDLLFIKLKLLKFNLITELELLKANHQRYKKFPSVFM